MSNLFESILTSTITLSSMLICTGCSLILGTVIALAHNFRNTAKKNFAITLAILPAIVQMVIMLVNGNLGAGVAVAGTFSLVRFRSAPGTSREISSIFLAMAVGLATGMGYLAIAVFAVLIIGALTILYTVIKFGEPKGHDKFLKITIPEGLDYTGVFDDLFRKYTAEHELLQVKTTNMGSLYRLSYHVVLRNQELEKPFIDDIRCRNGNLEISCGRIPFSQDEL